MCEDFREILGPKTIQQRQVYEKELQAAAPFGRPNSKVFYGRTMYTSVHSLMDSARIIDQYNYFRHDPLIESVLVELHHEHQLIEEMRHEDFLEDELSPLQHGKYVNDWQVEHTVVERFHDLIVLHVCRITTLALEATSIQEGLDSPEAIVVSKALLSALQRACAFVSAGIQDGRVFGRGM
jgi:hypothetical protein